MNRRLPLAYPGERIGLFGGSFDPAHEGHAHVARTALKAGRLARVWWLVTPQNPLKPRSGRLADRLASARARALGPRMIVTDFETRFGLRYSADAIALLQRRRPGVRFVWVMGEDAMAGFHRWKRWPDMFASLPILIVARPGAGHRAHAAKAFARFAAARRARLPDAAPGWTTVFARHRPVSSTAIRRQAAAAS